jgi:uncharacterized UPF0160 family protein
MTTMKTNKIHSNISVSTKKLITHNGSFHTDDVFAAATLSMMLEKEGNDFEIIRTRDEEIIKNGDYVFDVGGIYDQKANRFDHHQTDFKEKRENGIMYSSFGLVWKTYGEKIAGSKEAMGMIDKRLVQPIDAFDNGLDLTENKYEISNFLIQHFFLDMSPTWREGSSIMDEMFFKSVSMAKEILEREIIQIQDAILAEQEIISIYKNTKDKRIIILDKNYPYEYVLNSFPEPLFVIYPRTSDNYWGVKAIREDPKNFKNRKNFPENWAGQRDEELQKITGVKDAIFCHKALFLAVAKTQEGAIKLAELALLV